MLPGLSAILGRCIRRMYLACRPDKGDPTNQGPGPHHHTTSALAGEGPNAPRASRGYATSGQRRGFWHGLRHRQVWLALFVLLLALLPRLMNLDAFLTADEDDQIRFSAGFLTAVLARDWARAVLLGYPGVPTMAFGGLALGARYLLHQLAVLPLPGNPPDLATALADVLRYPLVYISAARIMMGLIASLAVLTMYLLMRRLLGTRVALTAAVFIAFEPMFLANSRILHVDAPLTYFMFLSFLSFWLYLSEGRWAWLVLSGVCGGLAALSKTPGVILGPILVATGLVYALHPSQLANTAPAVASTDAAMAPDPLGGRWRRFLVAVAVWGGVAIAAFCALWPSLWVDPGQAISLLITNVVTAVQTVHPTSGVFWGYGGDRSPFYYFISLPFHLTVLGTLGLLAGIYATLRCRPYRPLLLSLWAYVILFLIPVSLTGRRGDRYILPLFLPLDMVAALALTWLAQRWSQPGQTESAAARGRWRSFWPWMRRRAGWLLALAVGVQTVFVLALHPYYFDYFNPLLGGGSTAPRFVNIGWGEGLDQAAAYLNQLPDAEHKTVAAWYSWQFAPFFKGRTTDLSSNEPALMADYTVFYINQLQRGFPSPELLQYFQDREPMHTVWLNGVEYALIYPGPIIGFAPPTGIQQPVDVTLGGAVHLMGYDLARAGPHADDPMHVTLYWQVLSPVGDDYNVYLRLTDESGNVFGHVDRLPLAGLWRTNQWQPGHIIRDEYRLSLRPGTPPDVYYLEVSMYSFATGETFGVARNIGRIEVESARVVPAVDQLAAQHPVRVMVAPGLELLGYDLGVEKLGPGERLPATLYWRSTYGLTTDYSILFEAKNVAGREGGSWTEPLGSELYPTSQWRRGEVQVSMHQLQMPPSARSGFYVLNMRLLDGSTGQAVGREILGKLEFVERERDFETPQVESAVGVDLNNVAQLIGYDLPQRTVRAGQTFPITLYWRALEESATSYTVFIHVVGPDGSIRGQWDSIPGAGTLPTTGWVNGEVITDRYMVPMEPDAPPWQYTIQVGMYDPRNGARLPVVGSSGSDYVSLGAISGE
jgi:hypothetical protein